MSMHTDTMRQDLRALLTLAIAIGSPIEHWTVIDAEHITVELARWGIPDVLTPEGMEEAEATYHALNTWEHRQRTQRHLLHRD